MMNWLIITDKNIDIKEIAILLEEQGSKLRNVNAIPIDEKDLMFYAIGPEDLRTKLIKNNKIKGIYPDSEMTYYS